MRTLSNVTGIYSRKCSKQSCLLLLLKTAWECQLMCWKNFKPRLQNRILVSLKGSFQNFPTSVPILLIKNSPPPPRGLTFIPVSVQTKAAASAFCAWRILAVRSVTLYCPAVESTASLAHACCTGEVSSYPNLINTVGFPCNEVKAFILSLWCEIRKSKRYSQSIHHDSLIRKYTTRKMHEGCPILRQIQLALYCIICT